jgi:hypothetical protein
VLHELVNLLPPLAGTLPLVLACLGAVAGVALWLAGSRFTRPLATLLAVAVGGLLGLEIPGWFGLSIAPAWMACGLSLAMGLSGYALPRLWVGFSLGLTLAAWAMLACWVAFRGESSFAWPAWDETMTLGAYLQAAAAQVPGDVVGLLPFAALGGLAVGVLIAVVWPVRTAPLAFSIVGLSLATLLGLFAARSGNLAWQNAIPPSTGPQVCLLLIMTAFGAIVQTRTTPAAAKPRKDEG